MSHICSETRLIGIVVVAAFAAGGPRSAITAAWSRTRSAASAGRRSILSLRPGIFDRHVLALDLADFAETLVEHPHQVRYQVSRPAAEDSDHRHRRLLRQRSKRPTRRTPENRDELAPSHVTAQPWVLRQISG